MLGLKAEAPTKDYSRLYFEPNARFIWFGNGEIWGQVTDHRAIRELWFLGKMSLVKFTLASPLSPALLSWNLILYLINIYINKFHVDQEHSTGVDVLPLRI